MTTATAGFFLGVDGGQSSTKAWIGDAAGRVVGSGSAGPCNHVGAAEGRAKFVRALQGCLAEACQAAGLEPGRVEFDAACLGFSGGPADKEALVREMLRARRLQVTHDAMIALTGATGGEPGVIVIAGTGSIAFGRDEAGRTARAGGWGYLFGDEGGAFDLARQALRAALRFEEGWGPPTALHRALLEAGGASSANDLLHLFYTEAWPRDRIAACARLVGEAALAGDPVALELLHAAGRQLAALAGAVRRQLFGDEGPALVSLAGSVFDNPYVRERFRMQVERNPANRFLTPRHPPAGGALLEAYRLGGRPDIRLQPPA